ncbi:GntR family transcriptional regulator [Kroppenstedtia eburnea]|uniref:GntR family transcriptional regulator n=1 Tax=Kroppenstedtia eburnea TaxID=714067 RepID=A0A1N7MFQ6_9BACL|nr:GntR family transcriptional regulator [Kroppenstedtia eburnea]QKI81543.1 GntR family transcriptional regulator [Kroppenstedtia eburnea]SIS84878.1 GntR family transcriptional regulator [Kroppenstedtia eburnea]
MDKLDKYVPIPLYFQLKEIILKKIRDGTYQVEDAIPTEKELSEMYNISRTTVRQAITELVQEGWLYRVKSKGTFVRTPKIAQSFIQALGSFNDQIRALGMNPSTEVLDFKVMDAPEPVAEQLKLQQEDKVIYIHRRRFADNEPIVMVKTFLPYEKCSFVLDHDLVKGSLYPVLGTKSETSISKIRRFIEAVEADDYDVENLNVAPGSAIQKFLSIGYNVNDEPIEYSVARYRGDKNRFEIVITAK